MGYGVERPEKLDYVLKEAFKSEKPVIIDALVDSEKIAVATKRVD